MRTLKNWTAKRAGGRITVYGEDSITGEKVRVAGVDTIQPDPDYARCTAIVKDGEQVKLWVG